ncbi:RNA polymerase sigma factor FliA, partial [Vibrio natriegens]
MPYGQYQQSPHAFIERYSPLVKRIAHHLMGRLPPNVQ